MRKSHCVSNRCHVKRVSLASLPFAKKICHVFEKMEYNSIFEITVIYMHGLKFNVKIRIHTIFLTVDHLSFAHTPAAASFHTWRNEMARLYIRQAGRKNVYDPNGLDMSDITYESECAKCLNHLYR